jgi:hypothetical protein
MAASDDFARDREGNFIRPHVPGDVSSPLEQLAILAMQRGTFETTRDGEDSSDDDDAGAAPRNKALVVTHLGFNLHAGIMIREKFAGTWDKKALPSGHTYSGHPMCVAAGLATVRAYREENLFERAKELESMIAPALAAIAKKHAIVGDARGVGAFFALELVKDRTTKEPLVPWHGDGPGVMKNFYGELRKRGVITFGKFNCVMVAPPLTTTKAELDEALSAVDDALTAFEATL